MLDGVDIGVRQCRQNLLLIVFIAVEAEQSRFFAYDRVDLVCWTRRVG